MPVRHARHLPYRSVPDGLFLPVTFMKLIHVLLGMYWCVFVVATVQRRVDHVLQLGVVCLPRL
jgi:hypothetical protein